MDPLQRFGGKRFVLAIVGFFTLVAMRALAWIDVPAFVELAGLVLGGYLGANTWTQHQETKASVERARMAKEGDQ